MKEMLYEYEILKDYFLLACGSMSDSEFYYTLGKLNTLAGYTNNLADYASVLKAIERNI